MNSSPLRSSHILFFLVVCLLLFPRLQARSVHADSLGVSSFPHRACTGVSLQGGGGTFYSLAFSNSFAAGNGKYLVLDLAYSYSTTDYYAFCSGYKSFRSNDYQVYSHENRSAFSLMLFYDHDSPRKVHFIAGAGSALLNGNFRVKRQTEFSPSSSLGKDEVTLIKNGALFSLFGGFQFGNMHQRVYARTGLQLVYSREHAIRPGIQLNFGVKLGRPALTDAASEASGNQHSFSSGIAFVVTGASPLWNITYETAFRLPAAPVEFFVRAGAGFDQAISVKDGVSYYNSNASIQSVHIDYRYEDLLFVFPASAGVGYLHNNVRIGISGGYLLQLATIPAFDGAEFVNPVTVTTGNPFAELVAQVHVPGTALFYEAGVTGLLNVPQSIPFSWAAGKELRPHLGIGLDF